MHASRAARHLRTLLMLLAIAPVAAGCASLPRQGSSSVAEILATPGLPPEAVGPRMERALEGLSLPPEQARAASAVMDQWQFQMSQLHYDRRDLMDRLVRAFGAEPVNPAALDSLRGEAARIADRALQQTNAALLKLAPLLTPEQRAQLAARWLASPDAPLVP